MYIAVGMPAIVLEFFIKPTGLITILSKRFIVSFYGGFAIVFIAFYL